MNVLEFQLCFSFIAVVVFQWICYHCLYKQIKELNSTHKTDEN